MKRNDHLYRDRIIEEIKVNKLRRFDHVMKTEGDYVTNLALSLKPENAAENSYCLCTS